MTPATLTSIPLEVWVGLISLLITLVGTLGAFIGKAVIAELRSLRSESVKRGHQVAGVYVILGVICGKLGIEYNPPDP